MTHCPWYLTSHEFKQSNLAPTFFGAEKKGSLLEKFSYNYILLYIASRCLSIVIRIASLVAYQPRK